MIDCFKSYLNQKFENTEIIVLYVVCFLTANLAIQVEESIFIKNIMNFQRHFWPESKTF